MSDWGLQKLLWGREGVPSRRRWRTMGCGAIGVGITLLVLLQGASATDSYNYQAAWGLIGIGGSILVAVLVSLIRRP